MQSVGIRQLREQINALVRKVREEGEEIEIIDCGQVVARLVPVQAEPLNEGEIDTLLADLDDLAAQITPLWPEGVSAVDAMRDVRREL